MDESAGRRGSGATGPGNRWLRSALVEAAHSAARTKGTYLAAQYRRLAGRRGANRAAVAVGHTILVALYHMLRDGVGYETSGRPGSTSATAAPRLVMPSADLRRGLPGHPRLGRLSRTHFQARVLGSLESVVPLPRVPTPIRASNDPRRF